MEHTLGLLLLQIGIILLLSRLMGGLMRLIGQPQVIGEMAAGIILGPSVLGLWHDGQLVNWLFPTHSRDFLDMLAQIGVMFFMFVVGLELDPMHLRKQGRTMMLSGGIGVAVPFVLGVVLALLMVLIPGLRPLTEPVSSVSSLALFVGAAMSITAFPVLARIITERNLQKNNLGIIALTSAALNDVLGWCLLSVVVAYARVKVGGDSSSGGHAMLTASLTIFWAALYIAAMMLLVRPLLARLQTLFDLRGYLPQSVLAGIFLLLLLSSLITDAIGIHAIFGAFLLGAVMPSKPEFVTHLSEKFEDFTLIFLLPIFFALTGLRTKLGLLDSGFLWAVCGLIILVATVGKVGGILLAARYFKMSLRHAAALGVLMNTRGLMELIVLNIGYDLGVLSPAMFTMLVVMALATTFMTTPLLAILYPRKLQQAEDEAQLQPPPPSQHQNVLLPVSLAESAPALVRVGRMLMGNDPGTLHLLHLQRAEDTEDHIEITKADPLFTAVREAQSINLATATRQFVTISASRDIAAESRRLHPAWTIIGFHKPVFIQSILGGTVSGVLKETPSPVAILIDKGLPTVTRVLVPYLGGGQDTAALVAAERFAQLKDVEVTILHVVSPQQTTTSKHLGVRELVDKHIPSAGATQQVHFRVLESDSPIDAVTAESHRYDLLILGLAEEWNLDTGILSRHEESVVQLAPCSILIVRGGLQSEEAKIEARK